MSCRLQLLAMLAFPAFSVLFCGSAAAQDQEEGFGGAEVEEAPDEPSADPDALWELEEQEEAPPAEPSSKEEPDDAPAEVQAPETQEPEPRAQPLGELVDEQPPDGLDNLPAGSIQYGTGVCSACACCGGSGVVGGIALLVAIVAPGGVLLSPVVGCLGCGSVIGAPAVGVSAAVWLREWLGIWRGPWMTAVGVAYLVELLGVAGLAAGVALATWLMLSFVQSIQGPGLANGNPLELINPPADWAWSSFGVGGGVFAGSFALGLAWAILLPALGATLTYQLLGEQKKSHDIGFRVPGFFSPNHADEPKVHAPQERDDAGSPRTEVRPPPEPASMRY